MLRQLELVEKVKSYDPCVEEELLNKAYIFSMRAHGSQTRASGDPYFSHPVEMAGNGYGEINPPGRKDANGAAGAVGHADGRR